MVGQDVESRTAFEKRRFDSVAGNSAGMLASVRGAVLVIANVLDVYTTENFSDSDLLVDGVTLKAHSLYVCVAGGDADAIAQAIFTRKSPGCAMSGNTTVIVYDSNAGYAQPYPSYQITYQIANPQTFIMNVTIVNSTHVPSTAVTAIKNAILAAWAGDDGGSRARIGSTVFASRYYAAVAALGSWVQLISIKLGFDRGAAGGRHRIDHRRRDDNRRGVRHRLRGGSDRRRAPASRTAPRSRRSAPGPAAPAPTTSVLPSARRCRSAPRSPRSSPTSMTFRSASRISPCCRLPTSRSRWRLRRDQLARHGHFAIQPVADDADGAVCDEPVA